LIKEPPQNGIFPFFRTSPAEKKEVTICCAMEIDGNKKRLKLRHKKVANLLPTARIQEIHSAHSSVEIYKFNFHSLSYICRQPIAEL